MNHKKYLVAKTFNDFLFISNRKLKRYIKSRRKYVNKKCLLQYDKLLKKVDNKETFITQKNRYLSTRGYKPRNNKSFYDLLKEEKLEIVNSRCNQLDWDILA